MSDRYRSKVKAHCPCCGFYKFRWLYPVGTVVGVYQLCAKCCKGVYGCRPGFTQDGIKMDLKKIDPKYIIPVKMPR